VHRGRGALARQSAQRRQDRQQQHRDKRQRCDRSMEVPAAHRAIIPPAKAAIVEDVQRRQQASDRQRLP